MIALVDKRDVFGIFAANGPTKLIWGVASAVLLVLALLPRVGGGKKHNDRDDRPAHAGERNRPSTETRQAHGAWSETCRPTRSHEPVPG